MNLRPALAGDAPLLAQIHASGFDRPWREAEIAAFLETGVRGALADGAGFVLWRTTADEAEILTIAVLKAHRREGLGRALMAAALSGASRDGARTMFLEVAADNDAAIALYAAAGFAEAGRRKAYYKGADGQMRDALILRTALNRR